MTASFSPFRAPTDWNTSIAAACQTASSTLNSMLDVFSRSTNAAWQGVEAMSRTASETMQTSLTQSVDACQSLMGVRSPQQAADQQADYMRTCFDQMLASGSRLSELSLKTIKDSCEPLTQHMTQTVDGMMKKTHAMAG